MRFQVSNYRGLVNCRLLSTSTCSRSFNFPKDVTNFPDKYDSQAVESGWYSWWDEQRRSHAAQAKGGKVFSMILPPPNVTGHLHLGHALTAAIQDSLIRWHRMNGYDTIWVPGSDHAGIATQVVVEKWLKATENRSRTEIGREEFEKRVWQWKDAKGSVILDQLKQMGAILDWERNTFTMSAEHSRAVNEAFRICLEKDLIYRSNYLVNWCPTLGSAISDIEVDHLEVDAGKRYLEVPSSKAKALVGQMFDFDYQIVGSDETITVSTTRPETILGDVAVAVHPEDSRYAHLLNRGGVLLKHPLRKDCIPLISDREAVDPSLGTGAVKITPSHDANDFEVGRRHNLASLTVLDEQGLLCFPTATAESQFLLTSDGESFLSMPRFVARKKMLDYLKSKGLLRQTRDHAMKVPVCSRTGDIIEPLPRPQWFLRMEGAQSAAQRFCETEELKFHPKSHKKVWLNWFKSSKDWCISRQLWWGHQIPMWRVAADQVTSHDVNGMKNAFVDHQGVVWVFGCNQDEARQNAGNIDCLIRDEDVLDTWFSSSLLPLANFGWPDQTRDLERYYPLSLMETGHDILFFWVARMVMMSGHLVTNALPFKEVMLHGIITDAEGRKMSKSLGNVVDPMHVIHGASLKALETEAAQSRANGSLSAKDYPKAVSSLRRDFPQGIARCGADALRYGLFNNDVCSAQIKLDLTTIKNSSAFCNKIWQATRFMVLSCQRKPNWTPTSFEDYLFSSSNNSLINRWILSQAANAVIEVNQHWQNRDFHLITRSLRHYMYDSLCDVYLEAIKAELLDPSHVNFESNLQTLYMALACGLRLLHPTLPFVTEELHQRLHASLGQPCQRSILYESYPNEQQNWRTLQDHSVDELMRTCLAATIGLRSIKVQYGLVRRHCPEVIIIAKSPAQLDQTAHLIERLVPCGPIQIQQQKTSQDLSKWESVTLPEAVMYMKLEGFVDANQELKKVVDKLGKLNVKLEKLKRDDDTNSVMEEIQGLQHRQQLLRSLLSSSSP